MILFPLPTVRPSEDATFVVVPVPGARIAAVSADGRTVVGTAENRAFAWRRSDAPDGRGATEILSDPGAALAVSDDGSVIVGNGVAPARLERGGRRWVGSLLAAPPPWGPRIGGAAVGVSGDGAVVVGTTVLNYEIRGRQSRRAEGYGEAAFLRERPLSARRGEPTSGETTSGEPISGETGATEGGTVQRGIGELVEAAPTGDVDPARVIREQPEPSRGFALGWGSAATAVSGDGATIVGTLAQPGAGFRWTEDGAVEPIGDLPGGKAETIPNAVDADGATIVGSALSKDGVEAFRWTAKDGIVGLGDLAGGRFRSVARAVSADGTLVVGVATGSEGDRAFVWSAKDGMRPLDEIVAAPKGWRLAEAVAVRPAPGGGLLVAGNGFDADGQPAAFLATFARAE